jgi:hypothetical protein
MTASESFQRLGETQQRAHRGHARGVWRGQAQLLRQLAIRHALVQPQHDQLTIARAEQLQRSPLPRSLFLPEDMIERRRLLIHAVIRRPVSAQPRGAPCCIDDAVEDRTPQVRRQSSAVPAIDLPEAPDGLDERVLDDVVGVGHGPRVTAQPIVSELFQRPQVSVDEGVPRRLVTRLDPGNQIDRGVEGGRRPIERHGTPGRPIVDGGSWL